jgi:hypothetical protein
VTYNIFYINKGLNNNALNLIASVYGVTVSAINQRKHYFMLTNYAKYDIIKEDFEIRRINNG